jgi:3-mercaptopyruvate sulfurtransferase SseA
MKAKKFVPLLLSAAVLLTTTLACNLTSQQQELVALPTENPYLEVPRVTLEEAKTAFDSGAAVFVDVRSAASYEASHIPGALSIPLGELESRINELDPDQWIITYCT